MRSNDTKTLNGLAASLSTFGYAPTVYEIGFAMELWAVQLLINGSLQTSLAAHLFSAISLAWALCYLMPLHFRPNAVIFLLYFLLCLLIPVVSGVLILLSVIMGLYRSNISNDDVFELTDSPALTNISAGSNPEFYDGRLRSVLRFAKDEDKRIRAVLSTRKMENENAVPLLRIALLDTADEVRLLAYSILDKIKKDIDSVIHGGLTKLKSDQFNRDEFSSIHYSLAESYWELSYLGLARGRARTYTLNAAKQHIAKALILDEVNEGLHVLHARILTSLGFYEEANRTLDKAKYFGMPTTKLAAFHAEVAFEQRRFSDVTHHVRQLDSTAQTNMILDGMINQWI